MSKKSFVDNVIEQTGKDRIEEIRAVLTDERLLNLCEMSIGSRTQGGVDDWDIESIKGGIGGSQVFKVSGTAGVGPQCEPWSVYLKILSKSSATQGLSDDAWQREALLYEEGLLTDLHGGLRAPVCFDLQRMSETEIWMWLEDVSEPTETPWSLARFALAAYHLGQVNGSYLTKHALPQHPWLLHQFERQAMSRDGDLQALRRSVTHPRVRPLLKDDEVSSLIDLWERRELILTLLFDRLPQTFGHMDSGRSNLFSRTASTQMEETVAIDWAFSGTGSVGQELKLLVFNSFFFARPEETHDLSQLYDTSLRGYLDGLRDAGWDGDADHVEYGCTGVAAMSVLRVWSVFESFLDDEEKQAWFEKTLGLPFTEILARTVLITSVALNLYANTRFVEDKLQETA